ncbi:MAG: hypothetical protein RMK99_07500 [Anaerolineales bacterium]|nr:hypothetical protein [Anaerolineales bacterium]
MAREPTATESRLLRWGWPLLLLALTLAVYRPALSYGLIWDDPLWYQQGRGRSALELFVSLPTYQFYRPLSLLYNRQFVSAEGVVNAPLLHALQIAAHCAATLLLLPVLAALGVERWTARLAALFFAVFPLSFQAVAWQAPQGPHVVLWLLLALLAAHGYQRWGRRLYLLASLPAYAVALLFQESALPLVFLFFWLAAEDGRRTRWPLLHLALAGLYLLIWLNVPRRSDVTGAGFQLNVLAYLLQGIVFPVARLAASVLHGQAPALLATTFAVAAAVLAFSAWRVQGRNTALLAMIWTGVGLAPAWVGLSWDYVSIGERLFYVAAPGIALLWASVASRFFIATQPVPRALGGVVLLGVMWFSLQHLRDLQQLYATGTHHLQHAIAVLSGRPGERLLFVNFPDRFELRPPYYPLGFWGLTLAPPVVTLSDFARALNGPVSAEDESLAAFLTGADDRAAWPYRVDLRGVNSAPEVIVAAARRADRVFISEYLPDGALHLREAGAVRDAIKSNGAALASFGEQAQLIGASVYEGERVTVRLVWRALKAFGYDETIFVHLWRGETFMQSADGDSLAELVPLYAWSPGSEIEDVREIQTRELPPGTYTVRVGLYRRSDGERLPATSADGIRFPDDSVTVGIFQVR